MLLVSRKREYTLFRLISVDKYVWITRMKESNPDGDLVTERFQHYVFVVIRLISVINMLSFG